MAVALHVLKRLALDVISNILLFGSQFAVFVGTGCQIQEKSVMTQAHIPMDAQLVALLIPYMNALNYSQPNAIEYVLMELWIQARNVMMRI